MDGYTGIGSGHWDSIKAVALNWCSVLLSLVFDKLLNYLDSSRFIDDVGKEDNSTLEERSHLA